MRHLSLIALLLAGCVETEMLSRPEPVPGVELSTVEAPLSCGWIAAVEVQSGQHDPTSHELLRSFAAGKGANYVVLDAFGVVANTDDIFAVTRARLYRCPVALTCYRCAGSP